VNGRCNTGGQNARDACIFQNGTTIHGWTPKKK
jgi:hypothetical protein